jgi:hypothetical protein
MLAFAPLAMFNSGGHDHCGFFFDRKPNKRVHSAVQTIASHTSGSNSSFVALAPPT